MKTRPRIFTAHSVRAIIDGTKTQTRRPMKVQPPAWVDRMGWTCFTPDGKVSGRGTWDGDPSAEKFFPNPHGVAGDGIWVRETFQIGFDVDGTGGDYSLLRPSSCTEREHGRVFYRADPGTQEIQKWRSPILMPRWASRLTLDVVSVRVERLQRISEGDARAEGASGGPVDGTLNGQPARVAIFDPVLWYAQAWDSMWAKREPALAWAENPWVFRIEFRKVST